MAQGGLEKLSFILSLQDRLSAPLKGAQRQIHALSAGVNRATSTITGGFLLSTGAVLGLMGALRPAIEFQRSLGEIRAMGVGPSGLKALETEAGDLANQFGIMANTTIANARAVRTEFGAMADDEFVRVTRAATLMGKALNLANPVQVLDSAMDKLRHAELTLGLKLTDSKGAGLGVTDVIERLRGRFGKIDTAQEEMQFSKAFGRGALDSMKWLVNNADLLRSNLKDISKMDLGAALAVNPFDKLLASANFLVVTWGSFLLPLLNPWIELLTSAAQRMQLWTAKFPNLTRLIGLAVVGVLLLALGIGALKIAWGALYLAFLPGIALLSIKIKGLALGWHLLSAAFWTSPITWIVLGIVALVAAVALAIVYWDDLKAAILRVANWFDNLPPWAQAIGIALAPFIAIPLKIIANWERIKTWFGDFWAWLRAGFDAVAGPGTVIGSLIALYSAPLAPGITVPDAQLIGGGGFSIPKRETVPGSARAVSNIANSSDNRRSVTNHVSIRAEKADPALLERYFERLALGR